MTELTDIPTQPEFVAWRKEVLDSVNSATGRKVWTTGQFNQAIGSTPAGRNWATLHETMRLALGGAPAATPGDAYTINSQRLNGQWRGYAQGDDGSISSTDYRGMTITRVAVGQGPESGNVQFALADEGEKVAQDLFRVITLDGIDLQSADAVYDQANQLWTWSGTGVSFGNKTDESMVLRHDPPAQQTLLEFVATDAGNGFVGYEANGRVLRYRGVVIDRFVTNAALQGIFVIDLRLGDLPIPQDVFSTIVMNGWTLYSADASFDEKTQTWVWTNTGFHFVEGQQYTVEINPP